MGFIRPATPGLLTAFIATIVFLVITLCVPHFKSIYFLKASLATNVVSCNITLGTLGYCLELPENTTCSKLSVGYQLDPRTLLGNDTQIQIPHVVVEWLTYALVLHIAATALAAITAAFGLITQLRETHLSWSLLFSVFAAGIALVAFLFDIGFCFTVKSRINKTQGGSAKLGNAFWLTLTGLVLLFFSVCAFALGRRYQSSRVPRPNRPQEDRARPVGSGGSETSTVPLNAVNAEADGGARQPSGTHEVPLPTFQEPERQPLRSDPEYTEEELQSPYNDYAPQMTGYAAGDARHQPSEYIHRHRSSGSETGQWHPPQQQPYQNVHNIPPYGGHAAAYHPYSDIGTHGNMPPVGEQRYPQYYRPAGAYVAPHGPQGSDPPYPTTRNTAPTPMASGDRRRSSLGGPRAMAGSQRPFTLPNPDTSRLDEEVTVTSEAPPQYQTVDGASIRPGSP